MSSGKLNYKLFFLEINSEFEIVGGETTSNPRSRRRLLCCFQINAAAQRATGMTGNQLSEPFHRLKEGGREENGQSIIGRRRRGHDDKEDQETLKFKRIKREILIAHEEMLDYA